MTYSALCTNVYFFLSKTHPKEYYTSGVVKHKSPETPVETEKKHTFLFLFLSRYAKKQLNYKLRFTNTMLHSLN